MMYAKWLVRNTYVESKLTKSDESYVVMCHTYFEIEIRLDIDKWRITSFLSH